MQTPNMRRRQILQGAGLGALMATGVPAAFAAATASDGTGTYDWKTVPFGAGGFIDGFVYHPTQAGVLYARTDIGGMYRFDAAARAWVPLLDHLAKADSD